MGKNIIQFIISLSLYLYTNVLQYNVIYYNREQRGQKNQPPSNNIFKNLADPYRIFFDIMIEFNEEKKRTITTRYKKCVEYKYT